MKNSGGLRTLVRWMLGAVEDLGVELPRGQREEERLKVRGFWA